MWECKSRFLHPHQSYQSSVEFSAQNISSNKVLNSHDTMCCNFLTGPRPHTWVRSEGPTCPWWQPCGLGLQVSALELQFEQLNLTEHQPSLCVFISDRQIEVTETFQSKHEYSFSYGLVPGSRGGMERKNFHDLFCLYCASLYVWRTEQIFSVWSSGHWTELKTINVVWNHKW